MSGARHRRKGDRIEREIVEAHRAVGVHAERYPLSGANRFRGSGHDIDVYAFGREAAPLVAECKARGNGGGWWAAERDRQGTDWRDILLSVLRTVGAIEPCPVCELEPCPSPSFCELSREADARTSGRREVSRPRPTPLTLVEAIKQSVRDRGIAALKAPATRERLSRCDDAARMEIDRWLQQRKRAS